MLQFIDTHTHPYLEQYNEDREEMMRRTLDSGVCHLILPDIDSSTRESMLAFEEQHPENSTSLIGLHPTSVKENYKEELKAIEHLLSERQFKGIGEIGIDLYWDNSMEREQIDAFEYQLGLAQDLSIPVSIHSRKALDLTFASLRKFKDLRGVLHCFPGDENQAKRAFDMGFYIGVGGVVTFKNSKLSEVVSTCGVENVLLETDAPYLSPVPHRGERNESSYIPIIAQFIADLIGMPLEDVARITTANAKQLFAF